MKGYVIVIIVVATLYAVSLFAGLPCFLYNAKNGLVVPEKRYIGRENRWRDEQIMGCFAFVGIIHVIRYIQYKVTGK